MLERATRSEKTKKQERKMNEKTEGESKKPRFDYSKLAYMVDAQLAIEKQRVASEVGLAHLAKQGRQDPERVELHRRQVDLEDYIDGTVAPLIQGHPAYPWFSKVKGIGRENSGKVVGPIRVEPADYLVCPECHNRYDKLIGLTACPKCSEALKEPPFADTISALWKFAGFSVEDGVAPKRRKGGGKLEYNSQLRSMCWRLGSSLLRAKGEFYDYYLKEKDKYCQKYENQGIKIVPAASLPKDKDGKKYEPEGSMISEGHVHNQAMRKMIKLFLACLWLVWREAEGLPITKPYAIDRLGHNSYIDPWEMIDK